MIDTGLTHPVFGNDLTYLVIVELHDALGVLSYSTEQITDSLRDARLTKDAILENRWMVGEPSLWDGLKLLQVDIIEMVML